MYDVTDPPQHRLPQPDRWAMCVANGCASDVRLPQGVAPSTCPHCGHVYSPIEQDALEAVAEVVDDA